MLATRSSDGEELAIEHTLAEPFVSDKEDYAFFERSFLKIEDDEALVVPDRWIRVFIPVGTLHGHNKAASRDAIVKAVHDWIRANRLNLPDGQTDHQCKVRGVPDTATFEITLTIKAMPLPGHGALHVRRHPRDRYSFCPFESAQSLDELNSSTYPQFRHARVVAVLSLFLKPSQGEDPNGGIPFFPHLRHLSNHDSIDL